MGSRRARVGKMESDFPPMLVYVERKAGTITSALYLLTVPLAGSKGLPASAVPAG